MKLDLAEQAKALHVITQALVFASRAWKTAENSNLSSCLFSSTSVKPKPTVAAPLTAPLRTFER